MKGSIMMQAFIEQVEGKTITLRYVGDSGKNSQFEIDTGAAQWDPHPRTPRCCFSRVTIPLEVVELYPEVFKRDKQ